MVNFADALKTKAGAIERPPLLPIGTYSAIVSKVPTMETIGDGKWDTLDFMLRLQTAHDDVDQDSLKEYGGLGAQSVLRQRFMFNKEDEAAFNRTLFNLKRFLLDHLKIEGTDDTQLNELINNSVNHSCNVFVQWRPDKNDAEVIYAEIKKTAPLE